MVDHRADDHGGFGFLTASAGRRDWRGGAILDRLSGWLGDGSEGQGTGGWMSGYRLPLAVTALWLVALGAYATGYAVRLGSDEGVARALPTLDLMFFAFAAIGPVAMLWMVVLLQTRSARLSEALTAQSESALALADTLANLHESVDALTAGTTGKLGDAFRRVERGAEAGAERLDTAVADLAGRLDTALLDSVIMLDGHLRERITGFEDSLDQQRAALAARLESDALRLAEIIEAEFEALRAAQAALAERIEAGLIERRTELDRGIGRTLEHLRARLDDTGQRLEDGLVALSTELAQAQDLRQRELNEDVRQRQVRLQEAVGQMAGTVEGEIAPLLGELRGALAETLQSVAANPPASAEKLAALLEEAADRQVVPEREAISESVRRIAALENDARQLLVQMDRTSRLDPFMEPAGAGAPPAGRGGDDSAPAGLPLSELPRNPARAPLHWSAVIRALDGQPAGASGHPAVDRAYADPDVATVISLGERVAADLSEDGLHVADLTPEHVPARLWARFARGERGGEIATLAGIDDQIAHAIARTRLRDDAEFRAVAMRLVSAYVRLLERAAVEIGADPRLVEMAETGPGRTFMLLGALTRAFEPVPQVSEHPR